MTRSAPILAALLLTSALATPAFAKGHARSYPQMDKCMEQPEAANGVTAAMLDCTNAEIGRQEARMKAALNQLIVQNPQKSAQIQKEQAQWQQKMKRAAKKEYTKTGGTMDLLNGSGLVLEMTPDHADVLEKRLAK